MDMTCLYREDYPTGKDFPLADAERLIREEGWLDTPAKIGLSKENNMHGEELSGEELNVEQTHDEPVKRKRGRKARQ